MFLLDNDSIQSVWDMYYNFMVIIFGVDFPPFIAVIIFTIFLLMIFGCLFWIFKIIFRLGL